MMKRIILLLPILVSILFISGCKDSNQNFIKVDYNNTPANVQKFIDSNSDKNGVYLFMGDYLGSNKKDSYIFFNLHHVIQGEKAAILKDIKYDTADDIFNVYFSTEYTDDYSKNAVNKVIYKIKIPDKISRIDLHKDGTHIPFDKIGN